MKLKTEPASSGVPQSLILKPLLFIMFYSDLRNKVHHSNVIMYADNTDIFFANKDASKIESKLNEDMTSYCKENKRIINIKKDKTEVMLFSTAKRLKHLKRSLKLLTRFLRFILLQSINSLVLL